MEATERENGGYLITFCLLFLLVTISKEISREKPTIKYKKFENECGEK